jgi:SAM-dependent methyltransferase
VISGQPVPDYKEMIRQEWTGAAPLWQKWNQKFVIQTREATELVLRGAQVGPGMKVLDLASGTGEPALSLARAVGPQGRVVATDLVPQMLEAARQNAAAQELENMEFRVADAESLPFSDGEFDRVTCRFGIMFFADIPKAMAEILRVLKPGGRVLLRGVWIARRESDLPGQLGTVSKAGQDAAASAGRAAYFPLRRREQTRECAFIRRFSRREHQQTARHLFLARSGRGGMGVDAGVSGAFQEVDRSNPPRPDRRRRS